MLGSSGMGMKNIIFIQPVLIQLFPLLTPPNFLSYPTPCPLGRKGGREGGRGGGRERKEGKTQITIITYKTKTSKKKMLKANGGKKSTELPLS